MAEVRVGIVMGSDSDWPTMRHAAEILESFGVAIETRVVSAHRMPDEMFAYAESATERGLTCIIAGAGGRAGFPVVHCANAKRYSGSHLCHWRGGCG